MAISRAQCRAARGLMGWTLDDLAERVRVNKKTLAEFESGLRKPYQKNLEDVRTAFETCGIVFPESEGTFQDAVALKFGMEDPKKPKEKKNKRPEETHEVKQAMAEFWKDNPQVWDGLSESGREALGDTRGEEGELFGGASE